MSDVIIDVTDGEVVEINVGAEVGDRGPKGDAGPANTLAIGTVTKGEDAEATITGTAPNQTLNLVLPRGLQGIQGIQGATGATGAIGPPNSLSVGTVTTGAAGSSASVTITGNAPNQTISFAIPRGDVGEQGKQGIQGQAGATGETGATGPAGPANSISIGTVDSGAEAAATITGKAPTQTLNLTLPAGPQGATGPAGPRGPAGRGNDTVFVVKDADDTVEDSATLVNDSDLQFAAAANSTYLVTMAWVFDEHAGRSKWSLSLPAGASIVQALHQFAGPDDYKPEYHTPAAPNMPTLTLPFSPDAGKENDGVNTLIAVIATGSTAGTVAFQFAQVTATTGDQTAKVKAGSWLRAELVTPDPNAAPVIPATSGVNVAAPSANVTLTTASKHYQFLAPSTPIDVTLPTATAANEGLAFVIKNEETTYSATITVKDASGATVTSVWAFGATKVVCTGSGWKFLTLGGGGFA